MSVQSQSTKHDARMREVIRVAELCGYEVEHSQQVRRLALQLFDELQPVHGLGRAERFWLECAALLHDVGLTQGARAHHKASFRMILNAPLESFKGRERMIIASVARYHRKALPKAEHEPYRTLSEGHRQAVRILSALIRVADGLDRSHADAVRDITCEVGPKAIVLHCRATERFEPEHCAALKKGDLFEQV